MKKIVLAVSVIMPLLLTACAQTAPEPVPTVTVTAEAPKPTVTPEPTKSKAPVQQLSDGQFLELVRKEHPVMLWTDDASIISLVKSACAAFDRGVSREQVLGIIEGTPEVQQALAFAIGAGVVVYCPQYSNKV